MRPLVVSGLTCVNALGADTAATEAAIIGARSGLAPNDFTVDPLPTWLGRVAGIETDRIYEPLARYDCRNNRLAQRALADAEFAALVAQARERYGARRIGLFVGTSTSGILETELAYRTRSDEAAPLPASVRMREHQNTFSVGAFVRELLGLQGPALAISTACSSSAKVFAQAARYIAAGLCDAAIVGGADSLCYTTLYGFHSLQLLSTEPCRPCAADRAGISIGEGAAFALLEQVGEQTAEHAGPAKLAPVYFLGYGESSDAHHMSSPDPDGAGAEAAMRAALSRAGLGPERIDYVQMHGTGTPANDGVEDLAIHRLFGERPAVSSTKGYTGHTLGAAGIMNVVFGIAAIRRQLAPGTMTTRVVDPRLRARIICDNEVCDIANIVVNAFGFGGNNASLVFGSRR